MTRPLKVEFTAADILRITGLANSKGITATSAVSQAISDAVYIHEKQQTGTRFYAIDPDGRQYEVSF